MIFKRYSSPFLFLENLIIQGKLCEGIDTIYKQTNEDKMWEVYLYTITSRALNEDNRSYQDWRNEVVSKNQEQDVFEVAENIEEVKDKARNMLSNFKP